MLRRMTPALPATAVVLFDGFDDLDAVGPLELLEGAGFPIAAVRPAGHPRRVHSAHGLTIDVEPELGAGAELVIVPGGGWLDGSAAGVRAQCETELPATLAALHSAGTVLASICTGAMLLAAAGVLTGRPAVTVSSGI
jgi:putative intracellular protease/amidase